MKNIRISGFSDALEDVVKDIENILMTGKVNESNIKQDYKKIIIYGKSAYELGGYIKRILKNKGLQNRFFYKKVPENITNKLTDIMKKYDDHKVIFILPIKDIKSFDDSLNNSFTIDSDAYINYVK